MEGLSSDVYLYDLAKGSMHRLTYGPEEIQNIDWSPDGKWVLAGSTMLLGEGSGFNEEAVDIASFAVKTPPSRNYGVGTEWFDGHAFIDYENQNGLGNFDLRAVDIETGKSVQLWKDAFLNFTLDPEKDLLVVYSLDSGPFLIDIKSGKRTGLKQAYLDTSFFGLGDRRFLTRGEHDASFIGADGRLVPADPAINNVSVAPDKRHWVSIGKTLKVFDADDTTAFELALPFVLPAPSFGSFGQNDHLRYTWRPDSAGLFIAVDQQIYVLDLLTGKLNLIETNLTSNSDLTFLWLTPN